MQPLDVCDKQTAIVLRVIRRKAKKLANSWYRSRRKLGKGGIRKKRRGRRLWAQKRGWGESRVVVDGGEEEVCPGGSSLIPGWRLRCRTERVRTLCLLPLHKTKFHSRSRPSCAR
ncbi:hypothetical protein ANTRET_LOCUS10248 [Anthophora retusa]